MEKMVKLRVELDISAQRILQQVQLNNETIEDQVKRGIELAIKDVTENNNFVNYVRESTKTELNNLVSRAVMSWELKNSITKAVENKLKDKLDKMADDIAEKLFKSLEK